MSLHDRIPGKVQVRKGADIKTPDGPQTDGMTRMPVFVDISDQLSGTGKGVPVCLIYGC